MASGIVGKVPADLVHITPKAAWEDSFDKKFYHWADSKLFYDFKEFTRQTISDERERMVKLIKDKETFAAEDHLMCCGIAEEKLNKDYNRGLFDAIKIVRNV